MTTKKIENPITRKEYYNNEYDTRIGFGILWCFLAVLFAWMIYVEVRVEKPAGELENRVNLLEQTEQKLEDRIKTTEREIETAKEEEERKAIIEQLHSKFGLSFVYVEDIYPDLGTTLYCGDYNMGGGQVGKKCIEVGNFNGELFYNLNN